MSKKQSTSSQTQGTNLGTTDQFSSTGFILAAIGSAVGLGNMWKFTYVTGENGGGAFVLLFIFFLFIVGLPVLLGEMAIGRAGRGDAVHAFTKLSGKKWWGILGFIAVLAAFLILTYYSTIAGWTLHYAVQSLNGELFTHTDFAQFFDEFTGSYWPIIWQIVVLALCFIVIARGISSGIEKFNKIVIPSLLVFLVIMLFRSLTLDGAAEGIRYFLYPDFSQLTFQSVLMALGLAFFSLSLGMGAMLTYGAYVDKRQSLPNATIAVGAGNLAYALMSGLIIFPITFTFGIAPDQGPGLIFVALPAAFASMPYGSLFGGIFFVLLAIAAITSCLALIEVPVALLMRKFSMSRVKAATVFMIALYVLALPVTLSSGGVLTDYVVGGKNLYDWVDFITSNVMLPLGGLFVTLLVGYVWKESRAETGLSNGWMKVWYVSMRYIIPILIVLILLSSIGII
ncbi:sodium-dependent transporter [Paenibacillus marinisediminis]